MNIYDFPPIHALITGASWLVTRLSELLAPLAGEANAALAVILLTVLVRIALIPVGRSQVKAEIVRKRLAPKIAALQKRYAKDREALQRKTMELYAAEKASPMAGCLPMLLQAPVLLAIYGLFILPTIGGEPNELITHSLLGVPLNSSLVGEIASGAATPTATLVHLAIMVVIAVVAQLSRSYLMKPAQAAATATAGTGTAVPGMAGLTRVMGYLPFVTAIIAAFVPLAAALYLMATTAWTLGERLILRRILGADRGAPGSEAAAIA